MEIIKQYGDFTKQEIFNLTQGGGQLLKNADDGTILEIERIIVIKDDTQPDKDPKEIMHIQTTEGTFYTTESPTVQTTINLAINFMETHKLKFQLYRSQSKAGRTYMNVRLV